MPHYTGVGSRSAPQHVLNLMTMIAQKMQRYNYILRSGKAKGADTAFELGAGNLKEIYRHWHTTQESMAIAANFWKPEFPVSFWNMKEWGRKLHGRNPFQVLGPHLVQDHRSDYCICWTADGCESHAARTIDTGGTGTAISIADAYGVPVINLANQHQYDYWLDWAQRP